MAGALAATGSAAASTPLRCSVARKSVLVAAASLCAADLGEAVAVPAVSVVAVGASSSNVSMASAASAAARAGVAAAEKVGEVVVVGEASGEEPEEDGAFEVDGRAVDE